MFVSKLDTRPPQHFSLSTGGLDSISLLIQWNSGLIFWLSWHHPASLRSICLLSLSLKSHWKLETCRGRNWLCGFLGFFFWALKWKGIGIPALSCNFVFLLRFYWQFVIVFIRLKREGAFNIHFQFLWPKFYPKWCLYFGLKKKKISTWNRSCELVPDLFVLWITSAPGQKASALSFSAPEIEPISACLRVFWGERFLVASKEPSFSFQFNSWFKKKYYA